MRILLIFVLLLGATTLQADEYNAVQQKLSPEQQTDAIYLEKNIMATCCFGGPLYMHGKNQKTEEAKVIIRKLLIEGKSTDEILDYFRNTVDSRTGEKYGNRILASPKASETVGKVSYWSVVGFAILGLFILAIAINKLRSHKEAVASKNDVSDEVLNKIENELSEQDTNIK